MPNRSRPESSVADRDIVYADASRVASWGIGVNIFLVVLKSVGGLVTGSAALVADAFNSIGDVASSLAVHGGLWLAQQDEDEDHPYGHTKAESIAALSIAILIAFSAIALAIETVRRMNNAPAVPPMLAACIAAISAVIKEVMYWKTSRIGKTVDSRALQAIAWDHRSDALCSGLIAMTLFAAPYLGFAGQYVDPALALFVCVLLIVVGIRLFRQTSLELMDQQADPAMTDAIRDIAEHNREVTQTEKLRVRKSGLEYFVDIHVQVDQNLTVNEGHRIGHDVKDAVMSDFPRVRDVLVHIEPDDEQPAEE